MIVDRIIYEGIFSSFYQTAFPTFMTQDGIGKSTIHLALSLLIKKDLVLFELCIIFLP